MVTVPSIYCCNPANTRHTLTATSLLFLLSGSFAVTSLPHLNFFVLHIEALIYNPTSKKRMVKDFVLQVSTNELFINDISSELNRNSVRYCLLSLPFTQQEKWKLTEVNDSSWDHS